MTSAPVATLERSIAHPSTDPPSLIARVLGDLAWQGSAFRVGLAGYDELMATLKVATDLEGIARIGDPTSPPIRLLRALANAHPDLQLVQVTSVANPWRWTRLGGGSGDAQAVALRQQTYSDVVEVLGTAGVDFRVLPNSATTAEVYAAGREAGSAVVDVDELDPAGVLIVGYLEDLGDVTYGLLSRRHVSAGEPSGERVTWLAMAAEHEAAGTLMTALERFSALGLDLDFLHSDRLEPGRHDFYLGFRAEAARVDDLRGALTGVGFSSRVLASFTLDG
ncbi:hypothetical protein [Nocardioides sp. R-C-SC26]|uniref:hypothetical protein n=1 Tax=Nocardioides sp. R-C-SC26 TaxID=2870414 RepID=UPI001E370B61|nr:hypothetical protein [Nocardioides sp. R-C-SC26]